jgi:hypothetical protein
MRVLCERLQDEYRINMESHVGALNLIVYVVAPAEAAKLLSAQIPAGHAAERTKARRRRAKLSKAKREKAPKANQKFEGGTAFHSIQERTATMPKHRAASSEDAAQTPPACDAVVSTAAAAAYSHAIAYLQPFLDSLGTEGGVDSKVARDERTGLAALQLIAAGVGPLRAPTCNHTLRVACGTTASSQALLRRALLLAGPGELSELQELRGHENFSEMGACEFILSMLSEETAQARSARHNGTSSTDAPVSRALASLRVVKGENMKVPVALLRPCAAALTELECFALCDRAGRVLPRCTRLESLTLYDWPPSAT